MSSSLNSNLVNLFDSKPATLTWSIDFDSNDAYFTSPTFRNSDSSFLLHLFKCSEIEYHSENKSNRLNVINANSNYFNCGYPVIFLNCSNSNYSAKITVFARISLMNAQGEKCDSQEGRVNFTKPEYGGGRTASSGGVYHFNFKNYLINRKLTVYCEVYVLNDEQCLSEGFNAASLIAVSNDQKALLESGKFADFVISVGGKEFKAHKIILASRSPVFAVMFEHTDTKEALEGRVEIEDVQSEVFEQFLVYLYSGKLSLLEQYAEELLALAEKYQVDSLKSLCSLQLSSTLTIDSLGKLLYLADLYRSDELKSNCAQFIKHFPNKIDWDGIKSVLNDCSKELGFELLKFSNTKQ